MADFTTEQIIEQQERIEVIEIALEEQERKLKQLRRIYQQERDRYKRMTATRNIAVFVPENNAL